jgi:hypothetical protein
MGDYDAFAAAWSSWEPSRQVAFLRDIAAFISEIGRSDLDERQRRASLSAAQRLIAPLVLTNRSDPRATIVRALRAVVDRDCRSVEQACWLLTNQPLDFMGPEATNELLDLLVEAEFCAGERIANDVITRQIRAGADSSALERCGQAAVYLIGLACGGRQAVAAVERLRKHGIHSVSIAEAAIRMAASFEPSTLGFAFSALRMDLEVPDSASPQDLCGLVQELIERCDPLSVLSTLVSLEPAEHARLFRAAIVLDRKDGPFAIRRLASPAARGSKLAISTENHTYDIDSLLPATASEADRWKTALVHTLGFWPPSVVVIRSHLTPSAETAATPEPLPLVQRYMTQLGIGTNGREIRVPAIGASTHA